jgi:hypothetical protein
MIAMDPLFNEPSVKPAAANRQEARGRMVGILEVLLLMPGKGLGKSLRTSESFYLLPLAPDYAVNDWLNDSEVERDHLSFFLGLAAKSPFIQDSDPVPPDHPHDAEVNCHGEAHAAFLAAYELDAPLVSFNHSPWSSPELPATVTLLDDEAELIEEAVTLTNFSKRDHFDDHAPWFARRNAAADPADLWARREELFPSLTFCADVESQLHSLISIIPLIQRRLKDLQEVAARQQAFDPGSFATTCRPTSGATFDQYGSRYDFRTPNGTTKRCGWHLLLPEGRRIYFSTDYTIGHIGGHLPTVRYH